MFQLCEKDSNGFLYQGISAIIVTGGGDIHTISLAGRFPHKVAGRENKCCVYIFSYIETE